MFGKGWSGARVWRLILWPVTALYCAVVASIVFAPVHVDDNEMGGRLVQLLDTGHAEGWLPAFITYSSIEQLSNVIMFIPGGFLFVLLLKPKVRPHVLYSGFLVSACIETIRVPCWVRRVLWACIVGVACVANARASKRAPK